MPILDDNTVIPSFLGLHVGGVSDGSAQMSNTALRMGEVKKIVYPDDESSHSKKFIEYVVEVQHSDGMEAGTTTSYVGCMLSSLFGGDADLCKYTLRQHDGTKTEDGIGVGSKVLLLCINGQTSSAIIFGGMREANGKDDTGDKKDDGHNFLFRFNGASVAINKDGELTIQFRGATKHDNTLADSADPEAEGSVVTFTKDGSVKVATKDEKESIVVDHTEKKVVINATEGEVNVNASDKVIVKSAGVHIGDAQENFMLGKTYRAEESSMHAELATQLTAIGSAITAAAASIAAAAQAMKVPVTGPSTGGAAGLDAASATLASTMAMFVSAVKAIAVFEGQQLRYLSTKNFND